MVDIVDPSTRSRMMSSIRGRDTLPERQVRAYLHGAGLRFRLGGAGLPGHPDVVLPRYRAAVFVHGCFWHRHEGCRYTTTPESNAAFWRRKFAGNVARDILKEQLLTGLGWHSLVVWECQAADGESLDSLVWQIRALGERNL